MSSRPFTSCAANSSSKTRAANSPTSINSSAPARASRTSFHDIWRTDMDRDIEIPRDERGDRNAPEMPEPGAGRDRDNRMRRPARCRREIYSISPDQRETMYDLGRFRVISSNDLVAFRYPRNEPRMLEDLRSLTAQGLVQRKSAWTGRDGETDTFWTLTKAGKRLLKRQYPVPDGQAIYGGFVKPAELRHDAAIYSVFRREAARIEKEGGRIRRVILDFELKKKAYSPLAKAKALPPAEYTRRQAEIAREHGLKVVNGHIVLPDLRIEYVDRHGVAAQLDLEVASENYHGSHAAEKAAAGFKIYASPDTAA